MMDKMAEVAKIESKLSSLAKDREGLSADFVAQGVLDAYPDAGLAYYTVLEVCKNASDTEEIAVFIFNQMTDYAYAE